MKSSNPFRRSDNKGCFFSIASSRSAVDARDLQAGPRHQSATLVGIRGGDSPEADSLWDAGILQQIREQEKAVRRSDGLTGAGSGRPVRADAALSVGDPVELSVGELADRALDCGLERVGVGQAG
jgi:hypothetical protein